MKKKTKVNRVKQKRKNVTKDTVNPLEIDARQTATGVVKSAESVFDFLRAKGFPYEEKTVEAYKASLEKMNLAQLQTHAVTVAQILPNISDRNRLTKRLVDEFLKRKSQYEVNYSKSTLPETGLTEEQSQSVLKILNSRKQ